MRPSHGTPAARLLTWRGYRKTAEMEKFSLDAIAREQAKRAAVAPSGRSAETVYGGHEHALRQTVIALTAGSSLDEHESPGEATLQVLNGRVRLTAASVTWEGRAGDLLVIPAARHALHALEDAAILLTVSKRPLSRTTVVQPAPENRLSPDSSLTVCRIRTVCRITRLASEPGNSRRRSANS